MKAFPSLNIEDYIKHAIANGIFTAVTNDIPELIQEQGLTTALGAGLFRWNFIYRNVCANLGERFQISYAKRGPWKVLVLYDPCSNMTFSIMAERNLSRVMRYPPKGVYYLEALLTKNKGLKVVEGQLRLEFSDVQRDTTALEQLRDELLKEFSGIIQNHMLVLFEYDYNRVTSARIVLLTPEYGIAFSEDWSKFLSEQYVIGGASLLQEATLDEAEPLVRLKGKKATDDLVNLPKSQEKQA
jgi:hypothetical protein